MKIIAVTKNYPSHNISGKTTLVAKEPVIFLKADSSLSTDKKPFFLPDFTQELQYGINIVVRIDRLGKNIASRFAHRYYSELSVGIDFTAKDIQESLRSSALPWDLSKSFDGSAMVGRFMPKEIYQDVNALNFHLKKNEQVVQEGNSKDMLYSIDEIIAYISRYFTLKMGDLIFTGTLNNPGKAVIGDRFTGYLSDEKLLDFKIH